VSGLLGGVGNGRFAAGTGVGGRTMAGVGGRTKVMAGARGSGIRARACAARGKRAGGGMMAGAGAGCSKSHRAISVTAERSVLPSADW
jgi:hypothetical protein